MAVDKSNESDNGQKNLSSNGTTSSVPNNKHDDSSNGELKPSKSLAQFSDKGYFIRERGISWPMTGLFLLGNMAGGGIVALPNAIRNTFFYPGIALCLIVGACSLYTSVLLGQCWSLLQKRHQEYRSHCRNVYPMIGARAMGNWMKNFVSVVLYVNQFGICVIYLLLSAKSISELVSAASSNEKSFDKCYVIIILAALLLPITWLKSPADFWWSIFVAMLCSFLSVVLIIVGSAIDFDYCHKPERHGVPTIVSMLAAIGNIVFAFGGQCNSSCIQHDMKKPFDFHKSTYMAFGLCFLLYMPMSIFANITYGEYITGSIINSIQNVWIQQSVSMMIAIHCLGAFCLDLNPFNQQMEEVFNIPQHFGWKRVLLRSIMLLLICFTALSVPNFGPLLDLVGSSTNLLTVLVFPILFYLYLNASGRIHDEKLEAMKEDLNLTSEMESNSEDYSIPSIKQVFKYNNKFMLIAGCFVMTFGIFVCICSSISAVVEITATHFEAPCYVQWVKYKGNLPDLTSQTYCCARHDGNLTHYNTICAMKPFKNDSSFVFM